MTGMQNICFATKVKQPGVNTPESKIGRYSVYWNTWLINSRKGFDFDLSKPDLLKKCLHGKTHNNNECLNGVVLEFSSKDIFVGRKVLEICICSAIINFNGGATGFCNSVIRLHTYYMDSPLPEFTSFCICFYKQRFSMFFYVFLL